MAVTDRAFDYTYLQQVEQRERSTARALLLRRALTLLDIANDHHLAVTVSFQTGVAALREEALEELRR